MTKKELKNRLHTISYRGNAARGLSDWANKLRGLAVLLLWLALFIGGAVGAFTATAAKETKYESASFSVFLPVFLNWLLYGLIAFFALRISASLMEGLAEIVHHTEISAQVALLRAELEIQVCDDAADAPGKKEGGMVPPQPQPVPQVVFGQEARAEENIIFCHQCGTGQRNDRIICRNCGAYLKK